MTERELRKSAKNFTKSWKDRGDEKQETQQFWTALLRDVFEIDKPEELIEFEHPVEFEKSTKFIDALIPSKGVLIEQKGKEINLNTKEKQSDGEMLTPFEQALRYEQKLGHGKDFDIKIRYIITCNFQTFQIYDLSDSIRQRVPIATIELDNLENNFHQLDILVDKKADPSKELEISKNAGEIVGEIYNAFIDMFGDSLTEEMTKALNVFCVRLVFCFFAEDAGLFSKNAFRQYLESFNYDNWQTAFKELFEVLDQSNDKRNPFLQDKLKAFPYVNGSLFSEVSPIPPITQEIATLILNGCNFDWHEISPTIFGAVFESTLNPETRRAGGMHYTSIENIHKVIDPLFYDEFLDEYDTIMEENEISARNRKLRALQNKMASKKFFDPACGSGNFLTETYISLRRLENKILKQLRSNQVALYANSKEADDVKITIQQFYGIEINDFAVSVAKTALWIAEIQMLEETAEIFLSTQQALPLRTYNNIVEGNALQIDWETVVPKNELSYIMGNPPFIGGMYMNSTQKEEIRTIFDGVKGAGEFDYVCGWYKIGCDFIKETSIKCAFVSTNSICQGESVLNFWKHLVEEYKIYINFAYTTFIWDSEASDKARVHCVIVGFSNIKQSKTILYNQDGFKICNNITPYLTDGENFFIESRSNPICDVSPIRFGSMPRDGGGFVLNEEERDILISKYPFVEKWIRPYIGAVEFLNNKKRYCIWLVDASPKEILSCPPIVDRIDAVRDFRLASKAAGTRKFAETPTLFCQIAQPNEDYIMIPKTSSGKRRYLPIGFQSKDVIASDLVFLIPNATLYEFGVLMSNVHNSWMRQVAGRLKSDYRYSKDIVYNNFPWCNPTEEQKARIEKTAQAILDARAKYSDCTLAELYSEKMYLFPELAKAHMANDKAVMEAYGFPVKSSFKEADCVAELMKMYQELTNG